jgi:spore coat protein U-like protein
MAGVWPPNRNSNQSPQEELPIMNFRATRILAAALLASSCGLAIGATATTNFQVTATVASNCIVTATPMSFGTYTPGGGDIDQTSTISVRCSNLTPYAIGLDAGTGGGAAGTYRTMSHSSVTGTLRYNLFIDTNRSTYWGDPNGTTVGSNALGGTGTGLQLPIPVQNVKTVYGRLFDDETSRAATPSPSAYTSTVNVNVYY